MIFFSTMGKIGLFNRVLKENRYVQSVRKAVLPHFFYYKKNTKQHLAVASCLRRISKYSTFSSQHEVNISLRSSISQSHFLCDARVTVKADFCSTVINYAKASTSDSQAKLQIRTEEIQCQIKTLHFSNTNTCKAVLDLGHQTYSHIPQS